MRREWIEMSPYGVETVSLEPSPSMRREWIEIQRTLYHTATVWSPSMRREWIEIADFAKDAFENMVSLHAEGVD